MNKKRKLSVLITLVSILTILSGILSLKIFNQINTSSNAKDGIVVENTSNSKETVTTTKKDKSAEITTKNYLIKTVYFDERKTAILKDEEGSELKLPITVSDKFNGTFSLQTAEGSPDNLKVGQTIILGKNDELYSFVK
ncbi:TPA: hypothetical protein ACGU44_001407 [Enterococcus faecium]|uniref:Uncharacterized protein n=3 Tax=Enterococcus faecium TaxID=1352 RepID=A0A3G1TV80_ENTFC|nr:MULTISPECIES: hypothetical protein [Enterococcus]AYF52739.1 hypothetical protein [Enterococcus faecium]EJX56240.1 hypothetical protein HMPREF1378_00059 [Enterococcus faecium R496]EKC6675853.1 hypothetical protein [Enterococcus faecium]EKC6749929.1 hypothetical protein [Enterococcus faecium]EKC6761394.1 hypothetical protein [Enterococcus faecium]